MMGVYERHYVKFLMEKIIHYYCFTFHAAYTYLVLILLMSRKQEAWEKRKAQP